MDEEYVYETCYVDTEVYDHGAKFLHLRSLSISDDHQSGIHIDSCCCYSNEENEETIDDLIYNINTLLAKDATNLIKYIHSKVIPKACKDRDIHSLVKLLHCQNDGIDTRLLEEIFKVIIDAHVNSLPCDTLFESMTTLREILEKRINAADNIIPTVLLIISTLYLQSLNHPHSKDIAEKLKTTAKEFGAIIAKFKDVKQCSDIQQDLNKTLDTMLQDIEKMEAKPSCLKFGNWRAPFDKQRLGKLEKELPKNMAFLEKYSCLLIILIQLYAKFNSTALDFLQRCVELLDERFTNKSKDMHLLYPILHLVVHGLVKIVEKHECEELMEEENINAINEKLCSVLNLFMTNKKMSRERKSQLLDTVQKIMFNNNVCVSKTILGHMDDICGRPSIINRALFHTQYLLSPLSFVTDTSITPDFSEMENVPKWDRFHGEILSNTDVTLHILLPSKQCLLSRGMINYKDNANKDQTRSHENTVDILRHLCQRRIHQNVIRLLVYQLRPIPFLYAIERPKYHCLRTFLLRRRSKREWLPVQSMVRMAEDMVNAVSFIHQEGVIHRNIICSSFSIRSDNTVVLIDFSLSQLVDGDSRCFISVGNKIPTRWSAPESLMKDIYDVSSDTWMLGQMLYELFTHGCHPFTELYGHTIEQIMEWVIFDELKPQRWLCIPPAIHKIILSCVESKHTERCTLNTIAIKLEEFKKYGTLYRSRASSIKMMDNREQHYPELDVNQGVIEFGLPESIKRLKAQSDDKQVLYYNLRKSQRRKAEKLAISESDLAAPDTPTYLTKGNKIEVEEPVTTKFMDEIFPAFREGVISCLQMVSHWPPERQCRESSQHNLSLLLRYKCRYGMKLLDIALNKEYGDPKSTQKYLETIGATISFVKRMHSKNWILRDICCSTLFRSNMEDQAVFMPRIGRFLHVTESNSTDGCIVDKSSLELFKNRRNWLPLEVLRAEQFSKDSDIYMLGMTIYEFCKATDVLREDPMSSRLEAVPFAKVPKEKLLEKLTCGKLLDKPCNCPDWLWQEVLKCLDRDHTKRPSAAHLMEVFSKQVDFNVEHATYKRNTLDSAGKSSTRSIRPTVPKPRKTKKQTFPNAVPNASTNSLDHRLKNKKCKDPKTTSSVTDEDDDLYDAIDQEIIGDSTSQINTVKDLCSTPSDISYSSDVCFGNTSTSSDISFVNSSESCYCTVAFSPRPLSVVRSSNYDYDYGTQGFRGPTVSKPCTQSRSSKDVAGNEYIDTTDDKDSKVPDVEGGNIESTRL